MSKKITGFFVAFMFALLVLAGNAFAQTTTVTPSVSPSVSVSPSPTGMMNGMQYGVGGSPGTMNYDSTMPSGAPQTGFGGASR